MENLSQNKPWIIAITGASGTCYARRLIQLLVLNNPEVELDIIISEAALRVFHDEEKLLPSISRVKADFFLGDIQLLTNQRITIHSNKDIGASIASGSYITSGMVIVPCSMNTLAAISAGISSNLIQRAADVIIKEKRKLIIVPRETPLSAIHLENMLKLAKLDVRIIPAMPGFYTQPKDLSELIDHMCLKIIDQMELQITEAKRWKSENSKQKTLIA